MAHAPFIQTVRGAIDPASLGETLMHEHLFHDSAHYAGLDPLASVVPVNVVLQRLSEAQAVGVETLVDVSPRGIAPPPLLLAHVAVQTELNIVVATGWYAHDQVQMPIWMFPMAGGTARRVRDALVRDATDGIDGSGVKPGIIKVASSLKAISEIETMIFAGAAQAQRATGLAITTHTHHSNWAEEQVDILTDNGADLDRVVIGHMGWGVGVEGIDRLCALADRGVTLGLDMIGLPVRDDAQWVEMAYQLVQAGFADRIALSHDHTACCRGTDGWHTYDKGWYVCEFSRVHTAILPALRDRGVEQSQIEQITRHTPRRILAVDPDRYPGARNTLLQPAELR